MANKRVNKVITVSKTGISLETKQKENRIKNRFVIYVEPTKIGCELSLEIKKGKLVSRWAVEDLFNGLTRDVPINCTIKGFYKEGTFVTLHIYDTNNKLTIIKNVLIEKRKEVNT